MKLPLKPYRPVLVACETPLEHLSHVGSDDSRNRDVATVLSSRVGPTTESNQGDANGEGTSQEGRGEGTSQEGRGEGTSQEGRGEGTSQEGRGEGTSDAERHP